MQIPDNGYQPTCERLVVQGKLDYPSKTFVASNHKNFQCPGKPVLCQTSVAGLSGGRAATRPP